MLGDDLCSLSHYALSSRFLFGTLQAASQLYPLMQLFSVDMARREPEARSTDFWSWLRERAIDTVRWNHAPPEAD